MNSSCRGVGKLLILGGRETTDADAAHWLAALASNNSAAR